MLAHILRFGVCECVRARHEWWPSGSTTSTARFYCFFLTLQKLLFSLLFNPIQWRATMQCKQLYFSFARSFTHSLNRSARSFAFLVANFHFCFFVFSALLVNRISILRSFVKFAMFTNAFIGFFPFAPNIFCSFMSFPTLLSNNPI